MVAVRKRFQLPDRLDTAEGHAVRRITALMTTMLDDQPHSVACAALLLALARKLRTDDDPKTALDEAIAFLQHCRRKVSQS